VPRLCEFYPGICLTTEEQARKNLSQGKKTLSQSTYSFSATAITHLNVTFIHTLSVMVKLRQVLRNEIK